MSLGNDQQGIWVTPADGTGKPELLLKTHLIAISKSDLLDPELEEEIRKEFPKNFDLHFFSAATETGLSPLIDALWQAVQD